MCVHADKHDPQKTCTHTEMAYLTCKLGLSNSLVVNDNKNECSGQTLWTNRNDEEYRK